MRELRCNDNAFMAPRHERKLPMQRLRSLPQGQWLQQTIDQAEETSCKLILMYKVKCNCRRRVNEQVPSAPTAIRPRPLSGGEPLAATLFATHVAFTKNFTGYSILLTIYS